jgi:hypothetical protein
MISREPSNAHLDLDRDLPVTPEDVAALRRLRATVPRWLSIDWRELDAMLPPGLVRAKPIASDEWTPFSLE